MTAVASIAHSGINRILSDESLTPEVQEERVHRFRKHQQYLSTEAYQEVYKLVRMQVRNFMKRYGKILGTWEEVEELANVYYIEAYDRFTPGRAEFTTHVGYYVWIRLINEMRLKHERYQRFPTEPYKLEDHEQSERMFVVEDFLETLSEDGKTVAQLVLDSPLDIRLSLKRHGENVTPSRLRSAVVHFLKDIGWAMDRIREGFGEVGEALRS